MSCYQCCQSFGILNKEYSCKRCRFSFCSKCLKYKIRDESSSNETIKICKKCYMLEIPKPKEELEIPKNLLKLKESNAAIKAKTNISDLENRVMNLRSNNAPIPSTDEIEKRLQNLRGLPINNPTINKSNPSQFYVKPKAEQDQISQLLLQMQDEVKIGEKVQDTNKIQNENIEKRLLDLKDFKYPQDVRIKQNNDYLNADKVLEQILDEIKIEGKFPSDSPNVLPLDQYEELPYCCLCTKDAIWRCHGCDEDLYCDSCYKKCHKKSEYGPHPHEEFKSVNK